MRKKRHDVKSELRPRCLINDEENETCQECSIIIERRKEANRSKAKKEPKQNSHEEEDSCFGELFDHNDDECKNCRDARICEEETKEYQKKKTESQEEKDLYDNLDFKMLKRWMGSRIRKAMKEEHGVELFGDDSLDYDLWEETPYFLTKRRVVRDFKKNMEQFIEYLVKEYWKEFHSDNDKWPRKWMLKDNGISQMLKQRRSSKFIPIINYLCRNIHGHPVSVNIAKKVSAGAYENITKKRLISITDFPDEGIAKKLLIEGVLKEESKGSDFVYFDKYKAKKGEIVSIENTSKLRECLKHKGIQDIEPILDVWERSKERKIENRDYVILNKLNYEVMGKKLGISESLIELYLKEFCRIGILKRFGKYGSNDPVVYAIGYYSPYKLDKFKPVWFLKNTTEMRRKLREFNPYNRQESKL